MRNVYFPEESIKSDDLYFMCYMVERIARHLKQPNKYIVNAMGHEELAKKMSLADVLHSMNPLQVESDWIEEYHLLPGNFDITNVDAQLCPKIPSATQMGKVYKRLILSTLKPEEDYAEAMLRVYNNPICEVIDNYNCSAYYEPSPYITRSYYAGYF